MLNIIKMYFEDNFEIKLKKSGESGFSLPVFGKINFDSAYDCLSKFFSETGCEAIEVSANDGFGSDDFAYLLVQRKHSISRITIYSDGNQILLSII